MIDDIKKAMADNQLRRDQLDAEIQTRRAELRTLRDEFIDLDLRLRQAEADERDSEE